MSRSTHKAEPTSEFWEPLQPSLYDIDEYCDWAQATYTWPNAKNHVQKCKECLETNPVNPGPGNDILSSSQGKFKKTYIYTI